MLLWKNPASASKLYPRLAHKRSASLELLLPLLSFTRDWLTKVPSSAGSQKAASLEWLLPPLGWLTKGPRWLTEGLFP